MLNDIVPYNKCCIQLHSKFLFVFSSSPRCTTETSKPPLIPEKYFELDIHRTVYDETEKHIFRRYMTTSLLSNSKNIYEMTTKLTDSTAGFLPFGHLATSAFNLYMVFPSCTTADSQVCNGASLYSISFNRNKNIHIHMIVVLISQWVWSFSLHLIAQSPSFWHDFIACAEWCSYDNPSRLFVRETIIIFLSDECISETNK